MSWDSYIESLIGQGQGHISQATIIGLNGSIWTPPGSNGHILPISQAEASVIGPLMAQKSSEANQSYFSANGIVINGVKYMFLREDEGKLVLGKKATKGSITIQSTTQAVIIAHTAEGQQQGNANKAVDSIAKYLEGSGY